MPLQNFVTLAVICGRRRKPKPHIVILHCWLRLCQSPSKHTYNIQYVQEGTDTNRRWCHAKITICVWQACSVEFAFHMTTCSSPVSIIPALPFQISMSDCWSKNTNTVGTFAVYPQSRHWYARTHAATHSRHTPPPNTPMCISNSHPGFSASLSPSKEYTIHQIGCMGRRITHISPNHGQIALDGSHIWEIAVAFSLHTNDKVSLLICFLLDSKKMMSVTDRALKEKKTCHQTSEERDM